MLLRYRTFKKTQHSVKAAPDCKALEVQERSKKAEILIKLRLTKAWQILHLNTGSCLSWGGYTLAKGEYVLQVCVKNDHMPESRYLGNIWTEMEKKEKNKHVIQYMWHFIQKQDIHLYSANNLGNALHIVHSHQLLPSRNLAHLSLQIPYPCTLLHMPDADTVTISHS